MEYTLKKVLLAVVLLLAGVIVCFGFALINKSPSVGITELPFQDRRGGVAVCSSFFKAVIFFHGLVIQIFSVNNEKDLINVFELRSQPCCFEGC